MASLKATGYLQFLALRREIGAAQRHPFLIVAKHLLVGLAECATAERQVIYGIEQIGLPYPIATHEAIKFRRQQEVSLLYVAIIVYCQSLEYHSAKLRFFRQMAMPTTHKIIHPYEYL